MRIGRIGRMAAVAALLVATVVQADSGFAPPTFAGTEDPFPGQTGWPDYKPSTLYDLAEGAKLCALGTPSDCAKAVLALYQTPNDVDVAAASNCYAPPERCPYVVADALKANRERSRGYARWGLTYTSCPNAAGGYCGEREQVVNGELLQGACLDHALPFQTPGSHDCIPTKTEVEDASFWFRMGDPIACKYSAHSGCNVAPPPPPPVDLCGNGVLDPGETCATCPKDAGECPSPPPPVQTCAAPNVCGVPCVPVPAAIAQTIGNMPGWTLIGPPRHRALQAVADFYKANAGKICTAGQAVSLYVSTPVSASTP